MRPKPATEQKAAKGKGFATECFLSLSSETGGEDSTQQPTEVGHDVDQPRSITPSVFRKHAPRVCFGLALQFRAILKDRV